MILKSFAQLEGMRLYPPQPLCVRVWDLNKTDDLLSIPVSLKEYHLKIYVIVYYFKNVSMKYFQVTPKWSIYIFDNTYKEHFCEK